MTLQTELDKPAGRIEWILCIEGIGWLTDESDFSSGFDGDVFVTEDLAGDLASKLGCTIHHGLLLPQIALEESFDPLTFEYTKGSLRFQIQDQDDILLDRVRPLDTTGKKAIIAASNALDFPSTTVVLDETDTFAAGDVAWICGREAVLLGTRSSVGGSVYSYANCTRGYLGTPRGRHDHRPANRNGKTWQAGSDVRDYNRFWWDRKALLFAHVPGEAVANVALIYAGRLRGIRQTMQGLVWDVPTVHDTSFYQNRYHEASTRNTVVAHEFIGDVGEGRIIASLLNGTEGGGPATPGGIELMSAVPSNVGRQIRIECHQGDMLDHFAMAFAYHYRRAPGGMRGVVNRAQVSPTTAQAWQDAAGRYVIAGLMSFDGKLLRVHHKAPDRGGEAFDFRTVIAQGWNLGLGTGTELLEHGSEVRFLLDNRLDDSKRSRFTMPAAGGGSIVSRNVVDVALMFMTSTNAEFVRDDAEAGSTTTNIVVSGTPFASLGADYWAGYALFAVEDDNLGEARVITSSGDSNITVDEAFTNTPTTGAEYQVRNTIYDVLPIGWGMGIPHWKIDLDAWENMRDRYFAGANLGAFAIGDEDRLDLWKMLQDNIFRPFGILPYINRTTGKLSARHVGEVAPTGIDETYEAIGASDMLAIGDIDVVPRAPAGAIDLEVRGAATLPGYYQFYLKFPDTRFINPLASGPHAKVTIRSVELDTIFAADELSTLKVQAHLNDVDHVGYLSARLIAHLRRYANPPPEVEIQLNMSWILKLNIGEIYSLTDSTRRNPINPYTGARGWSGLLARVVGLKISLSRSNPGVMARFQLLNGGNQARIAPAAAVSSKGSDGGGDYFQCADFTYALDESSGNEDWSRFGDNDRVDLRDATGAVKESEVINGTPAGGKIYVDGTIASSIAAGDYLTFSAWSSSNTDNMDKYVALGDASETLGSDPDDAKEYA